MSFQDLIQRELLRRQAESELCRRSFKHFLKSAWPVLEPSTVLQWGWHLDAICEHLEAVFRGQIKNLVITIPPGTTKSMSVSVMWPAWVWLHNPSIRWLTAGNDMDLAIQHSLKSRNLIESEWYQSRYGHIYKIDPRQDQKQWYENDKRGYRMVRSVAGKATGRKGDYLLVDDPDDANKVHQAAYREAVHQWWDRAFANRVNSEIDSRRVVIGQRTHPQDLIGHILEMGGFEELRIPEEFDSRRRCVTSIGWSDPRQTDGEWLRPERFGPNESKIAKRRLGKAGYQSQYQQDPQFLAGNHFKPEYFAKRWRWVDGCIDLDGYRFDPSARLRFGTVDPSCSSKTSADHMGIAAWTTSPRGDLVWLDAIRDRFEIPQQSAVIKSFYERNQLNSIGIESVAYQLALIHECRSLGMIVRELKPGTQDKLSRCHEALILAEHGQVWLPGEGVVPRFPLEEIIDELTSFRGDGDKEDAMVDCLSYAAKIAPTVQSLDGPTIVKPDETSRVRTSGGWERLHRPVFQLYGVTVTPMPPTLRLPPLIRSFDS